MTNSVFAFAVLKLFCRPIGQGFVLRSGDKKTSSRLRRSRLNFMTLKSIKLQNIGFVSWREITKMKVKNEPKMVDDFRL